MYSCFSHFILFCLFVLAQRATFFFEILLFHPVKPGKTFFCITGEHWRVVAGNRIVCVLCPFSVKAHCADCCYFFFMPFFIFGVGGWIINLLFSLVYFVVQHFFCCCESRVGIEKKNVIQHTYCRGSFIHWACIALVMCASAAIRWFIICTNSQWMSYLSWPTLISAASLYTVVVLKMHVDDLQQLLFTTQYINCFLYKQPRAMSGEKKNKKTVQVLLYCDLLKIFS